MDKEMDKEKMAAALIGVSIVAAGAFVYLSSSGFFDDKGQMDQRFFDRASFLSEDVFRVHDFMPEGNEGLAEKTVYMGEGIYLTRYEATNPDQSEQSIEYNFMNDVSKDSGDLTTFFIGGNDIREPGENRTLKQLMGIRLQKVFRIEPSDIRCEGAECSVDKEIGDETLKVYGKMHDTHPPIYEIHGCVSTEEVSDEDCQLNLERLT